MNKQPQSRMHVVLGGIIADIPADSERDLDIMSVEDSSILDEHHQEGSGPNSVMTPSSKRGHSEDCKEEQNGVCSPGTGPDGGRHSHSYVSPMGHSRRNKRKQSEPRRVSTNNNNLTQVVKEEPMDISDHLDDQGRLTTPRLTADTDDNYRYGRGGSAASRARQRYGQHRRHFKDGDGVDELVSSTMLSLQGHTSRASNSSEDSLDMNQTSSSTLPLHSMISMFGGGMTSDDAKSDIDDPEDAAGSQGTCAGSPEVTMDGDMVEGDATSPDSGGSSRTGSVPRSKKTSRSYKNLSRSRRIVANARERNRVHTISAAFEGLRRAVPSYSHNQKLSKLAILRIACSYILALASLADMDYSPDHQQMSFGECVDMCTRTLQSEGRSKRRKVPME